MNDPTWWPLFRRIVIFVLGCGVIVDALILNHLGTLIVGLLMVGVLPLDDLIALSRRGRRNDERTPPP
jgi:hypothetical protein